MRDLQSCGTLGGLHRHQRAWEPACDDCLEAGRRKQRPYNEARMLLKELHPVDWAALRAQHDPRKSGWWPTMAALIANNRPQYDEILAERKQAAAAELERERQTVGAS